nr:MAG: helix-turn-helix domain protein [Bacteriophage sp.]
MKSVLKPETPKILSEGIKDHGLKIKYVAGKVGVNPYHLGQVLKGNRTLSTDVAIQTARLVGVPLETILREEVKQ